MDLHNAIVQYLLENYEVDSAKAVEVANGIEFYLRDQVIPNVASDNDLEQKQI